MPSGEEESCFPLLPCGLGKHEVDTNSDFTVERLLSHMPGFSQ